MARKSSSSTARTSTRRRSTTSRGKQSTRRPAARSASRARGGSSNNTKKNSIALSARTRKAIDTLPSHAQRIFRKVHKNALKQYERPSKRRAGKNESKEQVAHKVAWSAVKKEYKKKGDKWVPKN
jgi:cation transport regulator